MSDFAGVDTVVLDLPGGKSITVKAELTYGEDKRLQGYATKAFSADSEAYGPDYERWFVKRMSTWIVEWSLVDAENQPVPVSESAIRALKPALARVIDDALSRHIEEQLKNALSVETTTKTEKTTKPTTTSVRRSA